MRETRKHTSAPAARWFQMCVGRRDQGTDLFSFGVPRIPRVASPLCPRSGQVQLGAGGPPARSRGREDRVSCDYVVDCFIIHPPSAPSASDCSPSLCVCTRTSPCTHHSRTPFPVTSVSQ